MFICFYTLLGFVFLHIYCLDWKTQTHLSPRRGCRCSSSVSSMSRNMVNCLTSMGLHTSVMQVYRHWGVRRLSRIVTGIPTAPPTAPTQPRHSRRQEVTPPGRVWTPWVLSRSLTAEPLPLTMKHNLPLSTITDTDRMHRHSENSHMNSMSGGDKIESRERYKWLYLNAV